MNKREKGVAYRNAVMLFIARAGYASTRQLARAAWGACSPSKRNMAGRTLRKLQEEGLIVTRRDGDSVSGEQLVALTRSGVNWVAAHLGENLPGERPHGRDWLRHHHGHRTACNGVFAALQAQKLVANAWTELEIRSDRGPLIEYRYRDLDNQPAVKIPDLMFTMPDGSWGWIEVENSFRSTKDMQKLEAFMRTQYVKPLRLQHLWFVLTSPAAGSFTKRLRERLSDKEGAEVMKHVRIFALDAESLELREVAD